MVGFCNGILTAMITPFNGDGVNFEEFGKMIDYQINGGSDAVVVLGTTGEPATMTEEEKTAVIEFSVRHAAGRIKVIVGTGSNDTKKAVAASVKAEKLGADGVLIGRPFVNMVYGGGAEGVKVYVDKLKAELADTMAMCGAHSLSEIRRDMIFGY